MSSYLTIVEILVDSDVLATTWISGDIDRVFCNGTSYPFGDAG